MADPEHDDSARELAEKLIELRDRDPKFRAMVQQKAPRVYARLELPRLMYRRRLAVLGALVSVVVAIVTSAPWRRWAALVLLALFALSALLATWKIARLKADMVRN